MFGRKIQMFITNGNRNFNVHNDGNKPKHVNMNSNPVANKISSLKTPMISRVHNAKPGCSACGKKVM